MISKVKKTNSITSYCCQEAKNRKSRDRSQISKKTQGYRSQEEKSRKIPAKEEKYTVD